MYQSDSFRDFRLIYKYVYVLAKRTFFCLNHINNNITRVNLFTYRTIPEVHSICANGGCPIIIHKVYANYFQGCILLKTLDKRI